MELNDKLKKHLAKSMYNNARNMLQFEKIIPWEELTTEQQEQCEYSMQVILGGIGSNEVLKQWFKRSGHLPPPLMGQISGYGESAWGFNALHILSVLTGLALIGLEFLDPEVTPPAPAPGANFLDTVSCYICKREFVYTNQNSKVGNNLYWCGCN